MRVSMAFMEFVRGSVTETGANTFTEAEIPVPTSKTEELAMLIWRVLITQDSPDIEDAQSNSTTAQLTTRSVTAQILHTDPAFIAQKLLNIIAGTVQGSLSEYMFFKMEPESQQYFDPPVLFAKSSLWINLLGVGNSNAKGARFVIGYTLERVSREEFIEALVD